MRCLHAALALGFAAAGMAQQQPGAVLVVAANSRDYLFGAGGALARMIDEGRPVYALIVGNEEKDSSGLPPAQTRLANNEEGERAARALGIKETLILGHKSGEFGQLSTSELRNQVMAVLRLWKPEIMFFPDWYIHYLDDQDTYWTGRMAEEAPYGGGSYFLQEMTYIGFTGYAAREYYFYSPYRPYRPREGGEGRATLKAVDIGAAMDRKLRAIAELKTSSRRYAIETKQRLDAAGRAGASLADLNDASVEALSRAFAEELASSVGARHGLAYAEEFNHLGQGGGIPPHILEKARRRAPPE
ncbi:MAG: PIG-L family deacetylase [Bryobacteraceae bacterium]|nr:PIG-L family deacetylase [Bryobacteraceae bacterium]